MKNKIIYLIGVCVLVFGYLFIASRSSFAPTSQKSLNQAKIQTISVSQTIFIPSKKSNIPEVFTAEKGETALTLLQTTTKVQTKGEGKNAYVTQIANIAADEAKKQFWAFYVNGKQAEVGAGSYVLQDGDKIEWKLETY